MYLGSVNSPLTLPQNAPTSFSGAAPLSPSVSNALSVMELMRKSGAEAAQALSNADVNDIERIADELRTTCDHASPAHGEAAQTFQARLSYLRSLSGLVQVHRAIILAKAAGQEAIRTTGEERRIDFCRARWDFMRAYEAADLQKYRPRQHIVRQDAEEEARYQLHRLERTTLQCVRRCQHEELARLAAPRTDDGSLEGFQRLAALEQALSVDALAQSLIEIYEIDDVARSSSVVDMPQVIDGAIRYRYYSEVRYALLTQVAPHVASELSDGAAAALSQYEELRTHPLSQHYVDVVNSVRASAGALIRRLQVKLISIQAALTPDGNTLYCLNPKDPDSVLRVEVSEMDRHVHEAWPTIIALHRQLGIRNSELAAGVFHLLPGLAAFHAEAQALYQALDLNTPDSIPVKRFLTLTSSFSSLNPGLDHSLHDAAKHFMQEGIDDLVV